MNVKRPLLIFLIVPLLFLFYSCGGGGSGSSFSPPADTPGLPFSLTLLPSQSIAQTNSSILLNAKVLDGNGVPVPNVAVTFTNLSEPFGVIRTSLAKLGLIKSVGILSATVVNTNGLGIASVSISSTTVGFATVQAEISNSAGISRARKTLFFALDVTPASPTLSLHADDGDGTFDEHNDFILLKGPNDNQRTIRADVLLGSSPVQGATVTFGTDLPFRANGDPATTCSDGTTTCSVVFPNGNTSQTNQSGQAFTLLQVNPTSISNLGTVLNVTAQTTINNQTASNLLSLFLSPVTVDGPRSSLKAVPTVVQVNGTSNVTAGVLISTGGTVPDGTAVNFSTTCGSIDPFAQTTGGTATAKFTAPSAPGICTISAQAGGVDIGTPVDITVTTGALSLTPTSWDITTDVAGSVTVQYFVSGGKAPYTVHFTFTGFIDPASPTKDGDVVGTAGDSNATFSVTYSWSTTITSAKFQIIVVDSAGTSATSDITMTGTPPPTPTPPALLVSPPSAALTCTAGGTRTFVVTGGSAPYNVISSNPNVTLGGTIPIPASGGSFTATVAAASCGLFPGASTTVPLVVTDLASTVASATLTVSNP